MTRITLHSAGFSSRPVTLGRAFGVAVALVLCLCPALRARAAEPLAPGSFEVAQVVLGIASYAHWPEDPKELRLCVVADAAYADGLLLAGPLHAGGRLLRTQRMPLESEALTTACQIVYIGRTGPVEHRQLFARLAGRPILSISEDDPTCSVGSMFCLRVAGRRVSFQVNLDSIARSGLRIHPNVLRLGRRRASSP